MKVFITGVAGFIGSHLALSLMNDGHDVVGIDNLNDYYDPTLKEARLKRLHSHERSDELFTFYHEDIQNIEKLPTIFKDHNDITHIVHLAAQAGVRYSLINPYAYIQSNVMGQTVLLQEGRLHLPNLEHFVYASSSSVYGHNKKIPFSTKDRTDDPVSLYAATKKSTELIARSFSHLFDIPATGLRFFTVYGPWGRPDMAAFLFLDAMRKDEAIQVFNNGDMMRDFTFINDIVAGLRSVLTTIPKADEHGVQHKVYNLGNNNAEKLTDYIKELETAYGVEAKKEFLPMQAGDVQATYADITDSTEDLGYIPQTPISKGIPEFVDWYKKYYNV